MSKFDAEAMQLPDNINKEAWIAWVQDRKERRKPLTSRAAILCLNLLQQYTHEMQSVIIWRSIFRGWLGLFPPPQNVADQDSRAWIDKVADRSWGDDL